MRKLKMEELGFNLEENKLSLQAFAPGPRDGVQLSKDEE